MVYGIFISIILSSWNVERWKDSPKVTQRVIGRVEIQTHRIPVFGLHHTPSLRQNQKVYKAWDHVRGNNSLCIEGREICQRRWHQSWVLKSKSSIRRDGEQSKWTTWVTEQLSVALLGYVYQALFPLSLHGDACIPKPWEPRSHGTKYVHPQCSPALAL